MNNLFIRPIVPSYTHVMGKASNVNAMLLTKGNVLTILCESEFDYSNGVSNIWDCSYDNLWIIEHDIIPTSGDIREMELCPYLICVPLYTSKPSHTGLENDIIPHRFFGENNKLQWISAGMQWCDRSGLGCIKIHKYLRNEVLSTWKETHWNKLDEKLTGAIVEQTGFKIHIHRIWVEHDQT